MVHIEQNAIVLFQGDSITDCGRDYGDPGSLGQGYALMAAARLGMEQPTKRLQFMNRGISGHRVVDLRARWEKDCMELDPTWVSILVGINETGRKYNRGEATSVEAYYEGYREILIQTREKTGASFILLEPFLLPVTEAKKEWREDLDPKIQAVRELAREFETLYVPLDGIFAAASTKMEMAYWAPDGVHPSPAGHALIAEAWLAAMKGNTIL
ncbi:SGNH/GDSL hydrolase family protein [Paenibacillus sp. JCM 10914]|uniref:SGNH/GDSL hydrolase family protein n=1 Tax=Paenibacillus sp. JCM 10914 TaxID=1236974 RepID=UPI00056AD50B|nr:SGNH/GDSL hydrolase family protein [Paenibacillus sp. JCM 10914]